MVLILENLWFSDGMTNIFDVSQRKSSIFGLNNTGGVTSRKSSILDDDHENLLEQSNYNSKSITDIFCRIAA